MLEGFETFMCPKTLVQLSGACASGPVVMINMDVARCDALIFHSLGEVKHVPLPSFSYNHVARLHHKLAVRYPRGQSRDAAQGNEEDRSVHGRGRVQDPMYEILEDLWKLVVKPILDAIHSLVSVLASLFDGAKS